MGFDLVSEPWIPVVADGVDREVSIREALTSAHRIEALAMEAPLEATAVLRQVLLPVLLAACGVPRTRVEWHEAWLAGRLDESRLIEYLDAYTVRFDLFDDMQPFGQVADLHTSKYETKPSSLLVPSIATGNSVPLFTGRTEADPPELAPAEAARALLACHCWDTAGIKSGAVGDPQVKGGKGMGNPTGPLGQLGLVVPVGTTLAETLLLNTPIVAAGLRREDRPQWERHPATPEWETRPACGLLDMLTWQSRRIRLLPEFNSAGSVVVRRVVVAAGDRLTQIPGFEPHTAWRRDDKPKAGRPPSEPVRHQSGRDAWRGIAALLATREPTRDNISAPRSVSQITDLRMDDYLPLDLRLQILTVGVVYDRQWHAIVEDLIADRIPLPVAALPVGSDVHSFLLDMAGQAAALQQAANRLGDEIRRAAGADRLPWDRGLRPGDALIHQFTPVVRRILAGLQTEPGRVDEADRAWRIEAQRLTLAAGEPLTAAAPPDAFLGRTESAKVVHRLSTAEAYFRAAIRDIVPLLEPIDPGRSRV